MARFNLNVGSYTYYIRNSLPDFIVTAVSATKHRPILLHLLVGPIPTHSSHCSCSPEGATKLNTFSAL